MNAQQTARRTGLLLLLVALAGAGFILGRMTDARSNGAGGAVAAAADTGPEVLYWRAPMDPSEIYDKPGTSKMGMDLVPVYADDGGHDVAEADGRIVYWHAPMDPTEIYDAPGKSRMGMALVPVYEDEAGSQAGGAVLIDPATVQNMGVRSAPVTRKDFARAIRTVGKVEYNEETLFIVNTKISGWIEHLHVAFVGKAVQKDEPLLEIYSPELVTTQQEYLLAMEHVRKVANSQFPSIREDAERLLTSTRQRLEYWDIPSAEIERLERTGEIRRTILLRAPATGIVVQKTAVEGAYIRSGVELYQIADLSNVWVHASIYDNEVPWISEGQSATMELSYLPGKTYRGRVSYVYPYLREKARDVHVRLVFANPDLNLKPGMFVNVQLSAKTIPGALVIPTEAIIRSGERAVVFVVRDRGRFEPREIRIGEEGGPGEGVRVLSGLLDGERVVTSAQFMLDSESRLQEAIQKMLQGAERQAEPAESATPSAEAGADDAAELHDDDAPPTGMNGHQMDKAAPEQMTMLDGSLEEMSGDMNAGPGEAPANHGD